MLVHLCPLGAHFVHTLTVVGVFISDVVECGQFRNQVSSKFNLKKLQYWLTWKRIHGAFGQGKFQHYRMVKKVIFFPCWFARLPWKLNAMWFSYGIICPAGILKEKNLSFWRKNARNIRRICFVKIREPTVVRFVFLGGEGTSLLGGRKVISKYNGDVS